MEVTHTMAKHRKISVAISSIITYLAVVVIVKQYTESASRRVREVRSLGKGVFLNTVFSSESSCLSQIRMRKPCFDSLCHLLVTHSGLRPTINMSIEEQVAMILHTIGHNERNNVIHATFGRSQETVSQYFHKVLCVVLRLYLLMVIQPTGEQVPPEIRKDSRFMPYFKDCIGAIDGTHIPCKVPVEEQGKFHGRKGKTTQNIMAAVTFDLKFTYVLAGWELDSIVLTNFLLPMITQQNIGKYYLVDAGYRNMPSFIAPYRGTRYHLNEI
uniref:DUF8040 domain-containing protein n=1 Tax=Nelumbo nucifera TaxID=4432 RepID=A0A822ZKI4_NELNU|nr:TPA_asm: hypothetical protein HUJ06_001746 [Nelumbo nucifera]